MIGPREFCLGPPGSCEEEPQDLQGSFFERVAGLRSKSSGVLGGLAETLYGPRGGLVPWVWCSNAPWPKNNKSHRSTGDTSVGALVLLIFV